MSAKTVFLFALICAAGVQVNNGIKIRNLLDDLVLQLKILEMDITISVINLGNSLTEALACINELVDSVLGIVKGLLGVLEDIVNDAINNANQAGVDISTCVEAQAAAVDALNFNVIEECRVTDLLDEVPSQLSILDNLAKGISNIITQCMISLLPVVNCLTSAIKDIQNTVTDTTNVVNNTIINAQDVATSCSESTVATFNATINDITKKFKKCVSDVQMDNY